MINVALRIVTYLYWAIAMATLTRRRLRIVQCWCYRHCDYYCYYQDDTKVIGEAVLDANNGSTIIDTLSLLILRVCAVI